MILSTQQAFGVNLGLCIEMRTTFGDTVGHLFPNKAGGAIPPVDLVTVHVSPGKVRAEAKTQDGEAFLDLFRD